MQKNFCTKIISRHEGGEKRQQQCSNFCCKDSKFCVVHQEKQECAICLNNIYPKNLCITKCNHVFHQKCIDHWLDDKISCPMCRSVLKKPPPSLLNMERVRYIVNTYGAGTTEVLFMFSN